MDEFGRFACFCNLTKTASGYFWKGRFFFSVVVFCPHVNGDFEYQKSRFLKTAPIVEIFGNITPDCQRFRVDGGEKEGFRANTMATLRFRVCTLLKTEKKLKYVCPKKITEYVSTRLEIPQGYSQSMCKFAMQALKNDSCQGRIKGYALSGSLDKERAFSTARFVLHDNKLRKISCIFENSPFFELRHTYLLTIATLIYAYIPDIQ